MGIRTLLFISLFLVCTGGALFAPILGVLGYAGHYSVGPERQWWEAPIQGLGIRYSHVLALMTALGIAIHWRRLCSGQQLLTKHEKLILLFFGIVWLSVAISEPTVGRYTVTDHPSVKFTKLFVFAMMLSHVVTDMKKLDWFLWVIVLGALVLGLQAYETPRSSFSQGRLDSVGGPDFNECNVLAAYLAAALPIIGIQFLRSGWIGKGICFFAGAYAANAIVLTRSRGAVVGLLAGAIAALILAPKRYRTKIAVLVIFGMIGGYSLTDQGFLGRASTINRPVEEQDASARSRVEIWQGALRMVVANPLGVGAGNFYQTIGKYAPQHPGRDAHNTFVRCAGDLGLQGLVTFAAIIASAFQLHRSTQRRADSLSPDLRKSVLHINYALSVGLVTCLTCGLTITLLYNEGFWWFLVLPVCLARAIDSVPSAGPVT